MSGTQPADARDARRRRLRRLRGPGGGPRGHRSADGRAAARAHRQARRDRPRRARGPPGRLEGAPPATGRRRRRRPRPRARERKSGDRSSRGALGAHAGPGLRAGGAHAPPPARGEDGPHRIARRRDVARRRDLPLARRPVAPGPASGRAIDSAPWTCSASPRRSWPRSTGSLARASSNRATPSSTARRSWSSS